jgi:hypothetical protein
LAEFLEEIQSCISKLADIRLNPSATTLAKAQSKIQEVPVHEHDFKKELLTT